MIALFIIFSAILNCFIFADPDPQGFKTCHPDDPINNTTILYYAHCASFPCPIRRGSTMTNTFSFIPGETHQRVRIIMYYNLLGVKVNYPGVHGADACDHIYSYPDKIKVGCPMEKGTRYIYEITERVRSDIPKVPKVTVHWAIRDQDTKKDIICYEFDVKIV